MEKVVRIVLSYEGSDRKTFFPDRLPFAERESLKRAGYLWVDTIGNKVIYNRPAHVTGVATLYDGRVRNIRDCKGEILRYYNRKVITERMVEQLRKDIDQGMVEVLFDERDGLILRSVNKQLSIFD